MSIHQFTGLGGDFMTELWWAFSKPDELSQEQGSGWLTWGVLSSRGQVFCGALGYPGSLPAPQTMGCSCLIIQSSQCRVFLHVLFWPPSQKLGNPGDQFLLSSVPCLWANIFAAIGHHRCSKAVCCHSPGSICPVKCSFSLSRVMFPMHFQSAGNVTEL